MKIHIKNGHVIDPKNNMDGLQDVYIAAGKIVGVGKPPKDYIANQSIDATGLFVIPGLVDLSAQLREPDSRYKATLESELQAAAAGGVTSLACPPDTLPILDEPGLVEMLKYRAKQLNLANVYPFGALTKQLQGQQLTEMRALTEAGCVGFSQADIAVTDTQVLWRAFEYAATFGYTLFLRAEDYYLAKDGVAHDGEVASRLGLKGIPTAAEALSIASLLRIAAETKAKLHLCRVSTAEGVDLIRQAKKNGVNVTADVSIQHLHLTEHDIGYFDTNAHIKPPLRTQRDKAALCQGVKDGTIDAICSAHTPVDDDEKLRPFAETQAGTSSLELLLPLILKWAKEHKITLSQAIQAVTSHAASILGIQGGGLQVNDTADVVIFDPNAQWKVSAAQLKSLGKNTPFIGHEMIGKVRYTLLYGQIVFESN
jgi:dihydroorotase